MRAYPASQLYDEMAFIAYHFHWASQELMEMEHAERRQWCTRISQINRRLSDQPSRSIEAI